MFDNHKFFNAWIISVNVFSAFGIYQLFKRGAVFKFLSVALVILITLSGFLNLLVVKNDVYAKVRDDAKNKFGSWIINNIRPSDIILTNGDIYDPATTVGARIFLGRPHYVFLFGGDPSKRILAKNDVLSGVENKKVREILKENKITYIIIYKKGAAPNLAEANTPYLNQNFRKVYEDNIAVIYKI